jgi:hypothetical protein
VYGPPGLIAGIAKDPSKSELVEYLVPVGVCTTRTDAPGIVAPFSDFTIPEIEDFVTCEKPRKLNNKVKIITIFFIFVLFINFMQMSYNLFFLVLRKS